MQTALRTLVIGVVALDPGLRQSLTVLLELELAVEVRSAQTLAELHAEVGDDPLLLVLAQRSALATLEDNALFGVIDIGEGPVDAAAILAQIRARLDLDAHS